VLEAEVAEDLGSLCALHAAVAIKQDRRVQLIALDDALHQSVVQKQCTVYVTSAVRAVIAQIQDREIGLRGDQRARLLGGERSMTSHDGPPLHCASCRICDRSP
jgi:hypothetical protein